MIFPNGTRLEEPFLNISGLVYDNSGSFYSEEGFLSLAFHPQYATNRLLYVYYAYRVVVGSTTYFYTRISEFTTLADNPNKVDISTERIVMNISQPFVNHNGGRVRKQLHHINPQLVMFKVTIRV